MVVIATEARPSHAPTFQDVVDYCRERRLQYTCPHAFHLPAQRDVGQLALIGLYEALVAPAAEFLRERLVAAAAAFLVNALYELYRTPELLLRDGDYAPRAASGIRSNFFVYISFSSEPWILLRSLQRDIQWKI